MLHPGRSGRMHLRMLAASAGIPKSRVTSCWRWSGWRTRPTGAPAATRSACASGSGSPRRCSGTRGCWCSTSRRTASIPQGIRWLRDFLRSLADEGRAVLVSSHVLSEVAQTAHEVVVIARGRSVAQAPLEELLATRAGGMKVAGPDVSRLAGVLREHGAQVDQAGDDAIVVHDRSGEQIGQVIAEQRIVISELTTVGSSLEEIFFELTGEETTPG